MIGIKPLNFLNQMSSKEGENVLSKRLADNPVIQLILETEQKAQEIVQEALDSIRKITETYWLHFLTF